MTLPFLPPEPSGGDLAFWGCAITGSLVFALRVLLVVVGGFADDFHTPVAHHDFDPTVGDAHHSEAAFKLISMNTIAAFIMMFGWSGLTASLQFQLGSGISLLIATLVGGIAMYITAWIYRAATRLTSPGATFAIEDTLGLHGSVYQKIPSGGLGKIQVSVNGMTRELDARSENNCEIPSFTNIEITSTVDHETVKVRPVNS